MCETYWIDSCHFCLVTFNLLIIYILHQSYINYNIFLIIIYYQKNIPKLDITIIYDLVYLIYVQDCNDSHITFVFCVTHF